MIKKTCFIIILLTITLCAKAQDWKSILGDVVNKVEETVSKIDENISIVGTWEYLGPDCKFTSDNFLSQAGGELASKKVEEQMGNYLSKLGFAEKTTFTFNNDSTYTSTVNGKSVNGTYSYNKTTKELVLTTKMGLTFNAQVSKTILNGTDKMGLLFNADKLMSLAQTVTGAASGYTSNATVSTINQLLTQYDGMQLGFELKKK